MVVDSSFWAQRVAGLAPAAVQEHCAEVMRSGTSWLMRPPLAGPVDRAVQRALDAQWGGLFVPASVAVTPVALPPPPPDAAALALQRYLLFSRSVAAAAERHAEVRCAASDVRFVLRVRAHYAQRQSGRARAAALRGQRRHAISCWRLCFLSRVLRGGPQS